MINTKLIGGLGNNMFQYSLGRILAEQKKYNLSVENIANLQKYFPNVSEITNKNSASGDILELGYSSIEKTVQNVNTEAVLNHKGPIHVNGFFQKHKYYTKHLKKIKKWFEYDDLNFLKPKENDLVIHYRLTDYVTLNWHLPPEAFLQTIEKNNIKYDTCYLITDQPNHPFIAPLTKIKNIAIINQEPLADFTLLKYAKQLIISHSTFSWWASFLGDQEKVYIPIYKSSNSIWKMIPNDADDVDLICDCKKYIKQIME
jgi:hypothetical protein